MEPCTKLVTNHGILARAIDKQNVNIYIYMGSACL